MAEDKLFKLKIIAPDRDFYEGMVSLVEFTTTEGDIGVLKGHIPLTCVIAPGAVAFTEEDGTVKIAALHSGFGTILQEEVTILAEIVEWPEEIDVNRANDSMKRAERRLSEKSPELDLMRAELSLKRALTRIGVKER